MPNQTKAPKLVNRLEFEYSFLKIQSASIGEQCKWAPGISIIVESLLKFYLVFSLGINQNCLQTWQKAFINAILFANRTKSFDKLLYLFDCPPCVFSSPRAKHVHIKGTVQRDFRPLVFFINRNYLGHWPTA